MDRKNEIIQWIGAVAIIVGHMLNAAGPAAYPWNILAFTLGTIAFFIWTLRVKNRPQMVVNIVALVTCTVGLVKAFN